MQGRVCAYIRGTVNTACPIKKIKYRQDSGFLEKLTAQMKPRFESGPTDGTTKNSRVDFNLNA